jgi:hypothetical protein
VQGIDELILHPERIRVRVHDPLHLRVVDIDLLGHHSGDDVPLGEDPHQPALVDD